MSDTPILFLHHGMKLLVLSKPIGGMIFSLENMDNESHFLEVHVGFSLCRFIHLRWQVTLAHRTVDWSQVTSTLVLVLLLARHEIFSRLHHLFMFQILFYPCTCEGGKAHWWSHTGIPLYDFFLFNFRKYLRGMFEETVVEKACETIIIVFCCCVTNHHKNNTHLWFHSFLNQVRLAVSSC